MRAAWAWVALAAWGLGGCIAASPGGKVAAFEGDVADMATPVPAPATQQVDSNNNPNARRRANERERNVVAERGQQDVDRNATVAERGRQDVDVVTRFEAAPVSLDRVSFERAFRSEPPTMGAAFAAERRMDTFTMGRR
jgi:hypothetical protein